MTCSYSASHTGSIALPGTAIMLHQCTAVSQPQSLCVYHCLAQKLPVTVSELVNESPAPTLDGSIVLGSQHTTVFLIDGASGQLIKTFYDFDGELAQLRTMGAAALGEICAECLIF